MAVKTKTPTSPTSTAPRIPAPASQAARAPGTRPSASATSSRLAVSPQAVSTSQQRRSAAQTPAPVPSAQKEKTPITLPPGLNAQEKKDAGLIGRVLDTAPKFAELVANRMASGQLSSKQLNDLAYIAKQGQVHGRTDQQVITSLGKAMNGMQPSVQKVFWQEFGKAMVQDTGHNVKEFGVGVYTAGKETVSGVANAARHPVAMARGVGTAIASGVVAGRKGVRLVGQSIGLGSGNAQAARNQLKQQANAAGQYVTGIAADPRKIGAVTFNAAASVLPLPGARAASTLAARAGATGAGKAALELLKPTLLKAGETVSLGRGLTGRISSLIIGKDGKQYAYVTTTEGQKKVLTESLGSAQQLGINSPVRNPRVSGNPALISRGYAEVNSRQKKIISQLPETLSRLTVKKSDFSLKDLAAITGQEGVEFAMFRNGGRTLIIRGTERQVPLTEAQLRKLADEGWRWSAHSHPDGTIYSSEGDVKVLGLFKNKNSAIITPNTKRGQFDKNGDVLGGWLP